MSIEALTRSDAGQIKARIIESAGRILMVKDCPKHGHFEDVLSIDPAFTRVVHNRFPGGTSRWLLTRTTTTELPGSGTAGAVLTWISPTAAT